MSINNRFCELRKALGMNQADFGARLGLVNSGVSNIEKGIREVQDRHIKLILAAFPRVSEAWLRTGEGEMFRPEGDSLEHAIKKLDLPDIADLVTARYKGLPPEAQKIVLEYTQGVIADIVRKIGAPGGDLANQGLTPDETKEALIRGMSEQLDEEKRADTQRQEDSTASSDTDTSAG